MSNGPAATVSSGSGPELPEFDRPPADPIALLGRWVEAAFAYGVREPLAVTLASADEAGRASGRVVRLAEISQRGLLFGTGRESARDFTARPWGGITFHWRETAQQVNAGGPVERLSDAEADELFRDRPPGWAGYRLRPVTIEFHHATRDRRLLYARHTKGWTAEPA